MVDNLCILFSTVLTVYIILRAALAEMARDRPAEARVSADPEATGSMPATPTARGTAALGRDAAAQPRRSEGGWRNRTDPGPGTGPGRGQGTGQGGRRA